MSILEHIPPPSSCDGRSLGEVNGVIEEGISEIIVHDGDATYPMISVDPEKIIRPSVANTRRSDVFLVSHNGLFRKWSSLYRSKGFISSLHVFQDSQDSSHLFIRFFYYISSFILFIVNKYNQIYASLYPYNVLPMEKLTSEFVENADWSNGVVRAFKWHPKLTKCALALVNDDIFIYTGSGSQQKTVSLTRTTTVPRSNDDIFSTRTGSQQTNEIFSTRTGSQQKTVPLLRHPLQKRITDLAWDPDSDSILAVSSSSCLILWHIPCDTSISRVNLHSARVIHSFSFNTPLLSSFSSFSFSSIMNDLRVWMSIPTMVRAPITSICYDDKGKRLFVAGPNSSKILLLDESTESDLKSIDPKSMDAKKPVSGNRHRVISKFGSIFRHGFGRLVPSPDGIRILALPASNFVRVYENIEWTYRDWTPNKSSGFLSDPIQSAVWSSNGRFLLLAPKNDPSVYALTFLDSAEPGSVGGSSSHMKLLDTSEYELPNGQMVGGAIQQLSWDANSERFIISFRDNPSYLAVFKTTIRPTLEVAPLGYLHGMEGERPLLIQFHDAFSLGKSTVQSRNQSMVGFSMNQSIGGAKKGSLVTIVWSSGVVSNIPFQYTPSGSRPLENTSGVISPTVSVLSSTPRSLTKMCSTSPSNGPSPNIPFSPINPSNRLSHLNKILSFHSDSIISPRKPTLFSSFKENIN